MVQPTEDSPSSKELVSVPRDLIGEVLNVLGNAASIWPHATGAKDITRLQFQLMAACNTDETVAAPTDAELWKKQADYASEREMACLGQLARTPLLLEAIEAIAVLPARRDERRNGMSWIDLADRNCKIARDALDAYRLAVKADDATRG